MGRVKSFTIGCRSESHTGEPEAEAHSTNTGTINIDDVSWNRICALTECRPIRFPFERDVRELSADARQFWLLQFDRLYDHGLFRRWQRNTAQDGPQKPWFERLSVGMEVGPTGAQFGDSDPTDVRYCSVWNGREIIKKCVEANAEYLVLWLRDGDNQ